MIQPIGPALPGTRQVLLAFGEDGCKREIHGRTVETHTQQVQVAFLPKGLMLWGSTSETLVHGVRVGNMTQVEISGYAPIPGRYFEQGRSFEEIQRLADVGELDRAVEVRQQLEMHEASPGVLISVALSGPYDRFCLWGATYSAGVPYRKATVEPLADASRFSGRLDEMTLAGVRTMIDVTAPDARTAADLLIGLEASRLSWSLGRR